MKVFWTGFATGAAVMLILAVFIDNSRFIWRF